MPLIFIKLLRPLAPYMLGIGLVFGAYLYVSALHRHLMVLRQQNANLTTQNAENLAAIAAYKQDQARWDAAESALTTQTLTTSAAASEIITKIKTAPVMSDAPVAPVLAQAMDGLRALQGGAP